LFPQQAINSFKQDPPHFPNSLETKAVAPSNKRIRRECLYGGLPFTVCLPCGAPGTFAGGRRLILSGGGGGCWGGGGVGCPFWASAVVGFDEFLFVASWRQQLLFFSGVRMLPSQTLQFPKSDWCVFLCSSTSFRRLFAGVDLFSSFFLSRFPSIDFGAWSRARVTE